MTVEPFPTPILPATRSWETLRIMVVSTPKTGNTWVKLLLAHIYDLPICELPTNYREVDWDRLGPRWVGQQHYYPERALLDEAAARGVIFITTVRHPGDVLVSLRHYGRNQGFAIAHEAEDSNSMLLDEEGFGAHARAFLCQGFFMHLHLSLAWLRGGWALMARYEELWNAPMEAVQRLTDAILPVRSIRVQLAVCACQIKVLQETIDPKKSFFRQGGLAAWRDELPDEMREMLTTAEPYPAQLAALGYTMDPRDPGNTRKHEPASVPNPFARGNRFDNGVPLHPVFVSVYSSLPEELLVQWPDALAVGPGSFFDWLNRPAAADPQRGESRFIITELAHHLFSIRPDVRAAFPDLWETGRLNFINWFLCNGFQTYQLDPVFRLSVFQPPAMRASSEENPTTSTLRWAWLNRPAEADPTGGRMVPVVSELADRLYSLRPDVQAVYPDRFGSDRVGLTNWFLISMPKEYGFGLEFRLPAIRSTAIGTDA